jgi:YbbR domain-containing protein
MGAILNGITPALIICLVMTLPVSGYPAEESPKEAHIKIPVVPINVPSGMIYTGPSRQGIEIHVRGAAAQLENLSDLKLKYTIDLANMEIGIHSVPVAADLLNLPEGLSVVSLNPSAITVRLDQEIIKEVPVLVAYQGKPAPGFIIAETVANPNMVVLRGPLYLLENIKSIVTHPIDVSGVAESFKKEITLDLFEFVEMVPPKAPILAEIRLGEQIISKVFKDVAIEGKNTAYTFQITPSLISIEVKGPARLLTRLETKPEFNIYVDLTDLKPGVYVRRATIELPVDTTLIHAAPEIFTVIIKKRK